MWNLVLFIFAILFFSVLAQNSNSCTCVPYFQCRSDGTININGEGIFDERLGRQCTSCNCTDPLTICCNLPNTQSQLISSGTCGYSNPDGVGFKVGVEGTDTFFGEFPWMIQIFEDGYYRCGGSLIHPSVVLTAAHCVRLSNSTYTVRGGEWDRSKTDEVLKDQNRQVSSIKIHEKFNIDSYIYDIALVFLEQPLELKAHINTTCLTPINTIVSEIRCFAIGWGNTRYAEKENGTNILKKIDLPIIKKSTCQKYLRNTRLGPYYNLHKSFICAGGEKDKDTCTGDGGGPLFCAIEGEENRYEQVGVVAWGIDCNAENVPGVYTDVAYLRKWIDMEMEKKNFGTQFYTY